MDTTFDTTSIELGDDDIICDFDGDISVEILDPAPMIIRAVICICFIILVVFIMIKYCAWHKAKAKRRKQSSRNKHVHRTTIAYYVITLIYYISITTASLSAAAGFCDGYWYAGNFINVSYFTHWLLLIVLYLVRLYSIFFGTAFEVKKRHLFTFLIINIICFIITIVAQVAIVNSVNNDTSLNFSVLVILWCTVFVCTTVVTLSLSYLFVKKLFQMNVNNLMFNTNATGTKNNMLKIMTKYTVLTIASCMTTFLLIVWLLAMSFVDDDEKAVFNSVANALNVLDVSADLMAITLAFSFADKAYLMLCCGFDKCLANVCVRITKRRTNTNIQMTSETSKGDVASITVGSNSPSPNDETHHDRADVIDSATSVASETCT